MRPLIAARILALFTTALLSHYRLLSVVQGLAFVLRRRRRVAPPDSLGKVLAVEHEPYVVGVLGEQIPRPPGRDSMRRRLGNSWRSCCFGRSLWPSDSALPLNRACGRELGDIVGGAGVTLVVPRFPKTATPPDNAHRRDYHEWSNPRPMFCQEVLCDRGIEDGDCDPN